MSTLGAQTALYAEDRGLQVPMALEHGPVTSSGKAAPGPDPRIRHRTQIGMFRPIRMDHTNCLQVAIKTLQIKAYSQLIHSKSLTLKDRFNPSNNDIRAITEVIQEIMK